MVTVNPLGNIFSYVIYYLILILKVRVDVINLGILVSNFMAATTGRLQLQKGKCFTFPPPLFSLIALLISLNTEIEKYLTSAKPGNKNICLKIYALSANRIFYKQFNNDLKRFVNYLKVL